MPLLRPVGFAADLSRRVMPGDLIAAGEQIGAGALATVGNGTLTGALIASGIITRTGPAAAYTDTTDTADAILAALAGANQNPDSLFGTTFRLLYINTVAFAMTLAAGRGVTLGSKGSNVVNVAASSVREYLVTILNNTREVSLPCSTTNGSATVNFVLPPNMSALPMGGADNPQGITITPGMVVTGTGINAGTTILNVTQGQGGITGVTLSANATATNNPVNLIFSPSIEIDGLRSNSL